MKSAAFHEIGTRDPKSRRINVVIDTPKGSRNKYKYDEDLGIFRISRVLPAGMQFPYDFGSVPRTLAEDGDALDVLVITDAPTFPGCLVTVRLIGVIRATQTQKRKTVRNDRLIAVIETAVNRSKLRSLRDVGSDQLREIEQFFVSYNRVHKRTFSPKGRLGPEAAETLLKKAMQGFAAELPA